MQRPHSIYFEENQDSMMSPVFKAFKTLFKENNVVDFCEQVFGFHSAQAQKLTDSHILKSDNTIDISLTHRIYIFSKLNNLNRDLLFQEINNYSLEVDVNDEQYPSTDLISFLKKHYSDSRLLKLFFHHPLLADEVNDLQQMLKKMKSKFSTLDIFNMLPDKPKSFMEIHDQCYRVIQNLTVENVALKQREDILKLEGHKILDNFTIKVPTNHYDLVKLGNTLNFCIGNGAYTEKINQGKTSIVALYKDNCPVYGIEFSRYNIKQARGYGNTPLSGEILKALEDALIKTPEVPSDFIKIEHHPFIHGYKYNNNELFMLLKGNTIYAYQGVSHDIYDGLVASEHKGKFFHEHIRSNFEYTKIENVA